MIPEHQDSHFIRSLYCPTNGVHLIPLLTIIPNSPLMIVHYLYITGHAILPAETDALLGIDADIVLVRPASGRDPSTQGFVE